MELVDIPELIDTEKEAHDPLGMQQLTQRVVGIERHVIEQRFGEEHDLQRRRRDAPAQRLVLDAALSVQLLSGNVVLVFAALQRFRCARLQRQRTAVDQALHVAANHPEKVHNDFY